MKRIAVIGIILSSLLYGAFFAAMPSGLANSEHGSMTAMDDCGSSGCSADAAAASSSAACVAHCLNAVGTRRDAASPVVTMFVLLAAVLVAFARSRSVDADILPRLSESIGKVLLHRRLASVMLRN